MVAYSSPADTFKIPFASMSKVTSNLKQATWRWRDPIEIELPKRIVVPCHRTLPFEDLDENTRLVVSVRRERLSLLRRER